MKTRTGLLWLVLICLSAVHLGIAKENVIQCANLIYAGNHTSRCFSDEFLSAVQKQTTIATERHFKSVKLDSNELFNYPFVMITGESDFHLTAKERETIVRCCTDYRNHLPIYLLAVQMEVEIIDSVIDKCRASGIRPKKN